MAKIEQNTAEAADLLPAELPASSSPAYRVLSPVMHGTTAEDQRRYEPGESIVLSDADAAPLLACGAVEVVA